LCSFAQKISGSSVQTNQYLAGNHRQIVTRGDEYLRSPGFNVLPIAFTLAGAHPLCCEEIVNSLKIMQRDQALELHRSPAL
jgi:hypothetical protein